MKLHRFDKLIRLILGFLLVLWAASGGPIWAYFGLYLLLTGSYGFCPSYKLLNLDGD